MKAAYPCTGCGRRTPVDELDGEAGTCLRCHGTPQSVGGRSCLVCGKPLSGYANRKTCSTRMPGRVASHSTRADLSSANVPQARPSGEGADQRFVPNPGD
jgi:hypothetical protein